MGPCMMAQIQLTPYLPDELAQKSPETYRLLINKLNNLISQNGLVISGNSERFILTCNCVEVSKHIVPGAPNKYAYVMDCNFYIGDGVSGVKYASISVPTKGVGNSESKAYMNAIKNLRTQSPLISDFLNNGTKRIIDYYERQSQGIFSSVLLHYRLKYKLKLKVLLGFFLPGKPDFCSHLSFSTTFRQG